MAQHPGAGEAPRAQPRARRRALGHRLVRGPHADGVRRRAGARHARRRWTAGAATSTTGASATRSASTSSTARRTPGPRSRSGAASATSSSSARPSRCWPASPLHDKTRRRRAVPREPAAHRARRHRRAELRQEGRELGAARRRPAQRRAQRRRGGGGAASVGRPRSAAARWIGRGALKELTSPAVMRGLGARRGGAGAPAARARREAAARERAAVGPREQ